MVAQFLLLSAFVMGMWAISDCRFIVATAGFPDDDPSTNPLVVRRGFGLIFNETVDKKCPWFQEEDIHWTEEVFENYFDFVGSDWELARIFMSIANALGFIFWCASLAYCCFSHVQPIRYLTAAMTFQAVGFVVMSSRFCDEPGANCGIGRGAGVAIASVLCYFFSGLTFIFMSNYPGTRSEGQVLS